MTKFISRLFLKESDDTSDPEVRHRVGLIGSGTGIFLNALLFGGKFFAGVMTGSIAVTADAFNNLSDAGSSIVTLLGFKLANQKPDRDHPFGHGRIEYLSGLVVAAAILLMGFELAKSSVEQIIHPEAVTFNALSAVILTISVAVKLFMAAFNRGLGDAINSAAMKANASDSMGDAAATSAVLIGSLAGHYLDISIDGWLGVIVSLIILYAGWEAAKDTVTPLLGAAPDPDFVSSIHDLVMSHEEIKGIHDLVVHDYGPGRLMISLHAEVNCDENILELHDVIDNIEKELAAAYRCEAVIHMDPIDVDDEKTYQMRQDVDRLAKELDPNMTIHDFRMVSGPSHTNLIFDMVLPLESKLTPEKARDMMEEKVSSMGSYFAVITVDRPYV